MRQLYSGMQCPANLHTRRPALLPATRSGSSGGGDLALRCRSSRRGRWLRAAAVVAEAQYSGGERALGKRRGCHVRRVERR